MITSKQRAHLRGLANPMDTILQVGKNGIGDELINQVTDALKARELIKLRVLETSPVLPREAAQILAEKTKCDIVQVIGTRFVLFKRNPQNPKVTLK